LVAEEVRIARRQQGHGALAEPAQDVLGRQVQGLGGGADQGDYLGVGIAAERGVGAGQAGVIEQLVPGVFAKLLAHGVFEQVENDAFHAASR
jgi:hypothetical protein